MAAGGSRGEDSFAVTGDTRGEDRSTRYSPVFVDLDADSVAEAVVYVSGRGWCGSGGCLLLVLKSKGTSYKVVGRTPITRPQFVFLRPQPTVGATSAFGSWEAGYIPATKPSFRSTVRPIRETHLHHPQNEPGENSRGSLNSIDGARSAALSVADGSRGRKLFRLRVLRPFVPFALMKPSARLSMEANVAE
jgi:hypothetical protein